MAERNRAEEELREKEKCFRSLIQNASDIFTTLDAEGTIHYKSTAVERILGYHEEEMVGTIVFDYVHLEDVEHVRRTFAAALESPGVHRRRGRTPLPVSGGMQPGLFCGADRPPHLGGALPGRRELRRDRPRRGAHDGRRYRARRPSLDR